MLSVSCSFPWLNAHCSECHSSCQKKRQVSSSWKGKDDDVVHVNDDDVNFDRRTSPFHAARWGTTRKTPQEPQVRAGKQPMITLSFFRRCRIVFVASTGFQSRLSGERENFSPACGRYVLFCRKRTNVQPRSTECMVNLLC